MSKKFLLGMGVVVMMLGGCASTPPTAKFAEGQSMVQKIGTGDAVHAVVSSDAGVDILAMEKTRIEERIEERVNAKKILNTSGDKQDYVLDVLITRYDKGNAFARAMLAGLGQIHLDGKVRVLKASDSSLITTFDIKKTFALGGIYGASVNMEDIEQSFANGIAIAVTGQKEDPAKK